MNIAWDHYQAYGDKKILEAAYVSGKRWLEFLHPYVSDGLLTPYDKAKGHFLGDWLRPGNILEFEGPDVLFYNNCIYAMTLDLAIHIGEVLGYEVETATYRERLVFKNSYKH
jgi:hypothetical protein